MALRNGPTPKPIPLAGAPTPLVAADLERLKQPRHVPQAPQRIRDSHHMMARLSAAGLNHKEVAERLGYSRERVQVIVNAPAMQELIATYRAKIDERFEEQIDAFIELSTRNMMAAQRHIADHISDLDDAGELLPVRVALAISSDSADRVGYGKHSTQTNLNVDFAAQLEKAIARSGKGPVLESRPVQPVASTAQTPAALSPPRQPTHPPRGRVEEQPVPLRRIRRA